MLCPNNARQRPPIAMWITWLEASFGCLRIYIIYEILYHHGSTLVFACCKANHWSHGKKVNFVQPQSAHPSTDTNQNLHRSLRKSDQQLCQIWWRSHHSDLRYTGVKYNTFVRFYSIFSFPSLPFPFYSCHRLQPKRLNRFSWLVAQNSWIGLRLTVKLDYIGNGAS